METILIVSPEFQNTDDIQEWTQNLVGNHVPGYEDYIADKVVQFQVSGPHLDMFDDYYWFVFVLIEVHPVV
jgi:hypothetical protein